VARHRARRDSGRFIGLVVGIVAPSGATSVTTSSSLECRLFHVPGHHQHWRTVQKKILVGAVGLALVATAVGGTAAYASLDKKVTLSVDGQDRPVSTFDSTVGDVLAEQHIAVGPRDVVAPATTAKVSDGTRIAVRFARELNLSVDGRNRSYWVTSTDLSNAFSELGLRFDGAKMSASRSAGIGRAGLTLQVATLKTITVKHDKLTDSVETTALTVGQALSADKVTVDGDDKVSTKLADPIISGDSITVVRVDTRTTKGPARSHSRPCARPIRRS